MKSLHFLVIVAFTALLFGCAAGTGKFGAKKTRVLVIKPDYTEPVVKKTQTETETKALQDIDSLENSFKKGVPGLKAGVYGYFEDADEAANFLYTYDLGYARRKAADGQYELDASSAQSNLTLTNSVATDPELSTAVLMKNGFPTSEQTNAKALIEVGKNQIGRYGNVLNYSLQTELSRSFRQMRWSSKHNDPNYNPWLKKRR